MDIYGHLMQEVSGRQRDDMEAALSNPGGTYVARDTDDVGSERAYNALTCVFC
jgi:hypothetical protein